MYDIIGDIHGHYAKLESLLGKLGYARRNGVWTPPDGRMAVFLGDLIDRGPEQVRVLEAVRAMCDAGHAHCIMGNHELNAIGYATSYPDTPKTRGMFVREHSNKNRRQHIEFLEQVGEGSTVHREWVAWFRTLPVTLDLGGIRAVHAWWHDPHIDTLTRHGFNSGALSDEQVLWALGKPEGGRHEAFHALEGLCKGLEIDLPHGYSFTDHAGHFRTQVRTRWWRHEALSLGEIAILDGAEVPGLAELPVPETFRPEPVTGSPIFIGHYWLQGSPELLAPKVACLDYSAARNGPLVGYRWEGESRLRPEGFIST